MCVCVCVYVCVCMCVCVFIVMLPRPLRKKEAKFNSQSVPNEDAREKSELVPIRGEMMMNKTSMGNGKTMTSKDDINSKQAVIKGGRAVDKSSKDDSALSGLKSLGIKTIDIVAEEKQRKAAEEKSNENSLSKVKGKKGKIKRGSLLKVYKLI